MSEAGFDCLYAFDLDPVSCSTLRHNLGGQVDVKAIEDLDPEEVASAIGTPDVVVGGPPCQGFSTQRRGSKTDPRNGLVRQYWEFALALQPKVIVMENVPGVLGTRGAAHISFANELIRAAGYESGASVVNVSMIGVPQRRRRAIMVAWDPRRAKPFDFSIFLTDCGPKTVRDAIGDMPSPPANFSEDPAYPNHIRVRMSDRNIERISHVPPGGGRLDIPEELQLDCHRGSDHRHLDVFGRLSWDEPAGTITAMFDNFTRGRFAHPNENRNITNREGARLQTFPDSYLFLGAKKEVARQIGNAVPPLLGRVIGEQILKQLAS
jgi:DNA (cytosine-5)-methyltransferase 1